MVRGLKPYASLGHRKVSVPGLIEFSKHLHLPVGHVVHAILYPAVDAVELRRQLMRICYVGTV